MEEIEPKLLTREEREEMPDQHIRVVEHIAALEAVAKEMAARGWYHRYDNGPPFCTWCHNAQPLHTPSCPITRLQTAGIIEV